MKSANELTKQEATVLALVAKGWRNTEIANELFISTKTVETHISRIFSKLGVSSRTQAALYAIHSGSLSTPEIRVNPDDISNSNSYA
jgi:DNA-binding NarL/FixJ family response regulator